MQTRFKTVGRHSGSVLVMTVIFCALVGLILVAYLSMVRTQLRLTFRAQSWNSCVPMCEAGIEEAMAHINHSTTIGTNFAKNGWVLQSGAYRKERSLNGGIIRMAINMSNPPTITVTGLLRAPVQSNWLTRAVRVRTRTNRTFPYSLLSKGGITMSGNNTEVDSFDSSDPLESTFGQYDPLKRTANATVATTSGKIGDINIGNGNVYGKVGTGPGGSIAIAGGGGVGDILWNTNPLNGGQIQPGAFSSDVNVYIPDPLPPSPFAPRLPGPGTVNGTNYAYVLTAGDYQVPNINLSGESVAITGNVRIMVDGQTSLSSDSMIYLVPGASIEFYARGDVNISGKGLVNAGGLAENFSLIGLPGCNSINYSGQSEFVGTIYAPNSDVKMSGSTKATGAVVGKSVTLSGEMSFHYDEALKGDPREGRFVASSWQEL